MPRWNLGPLGLSCSKIRSLIGSWNPTAARNMHAGRPPSMHDPIHDRVRGQIRSSIESGARSEHDRDRVRGQIGIESEARSDPRSSPGPGRNTIGARNVIRAYSCNPSTLTIELGFSSPQPSLASTRSTLTIELAHYRQLTAQPFYHA
jgi:hypothetical protein